MLPLRARIKCKDIESWKYKNGKNISSNGKLCGYSIIRTK